MEWPPGAAFDPHAGRYDRRFGEDNSSSSSGSRSNGTEPSGGTRTRDNDPTTGIVEEIVTLGYRTGYIDEATRRLLNYTTALYKSFSHSNGHELGLAQAELIFKAHCYRYLKNATTHYTSVTATVAVVAGYQGGWGRYTSTTGETGRFTVNSLVGGGGISGDIAVAGQIGGSPSQSLAGWALIGSAGAGFADLSVNVGGVYAFNTRKGGDVGITVGASAVGGVAHTQIYPDAGTRHICEVED